MGATVICPKCGEEDSIEHKFDAWACFLVTGFDADGSLTRSKEFDTQVFDASKIECSGCGEVFEESKLVLHLRKASDSVVEH